jgi:hypothetical protein
MADITYHCARVIKDVNHAPSFTAGASQSFTRCQDSGPYGLNSLLTISDADSFQTESWEVATAPAHGSLAGFSYSATSTGGTVVPAALSYTPAAGYAGTDTFRIRVLDGARSDTIAIYVTITPSASAGIISGAAAVCLVHTTPLTSTISGGTWLATNGNASITTTGTVMGIIAGLDTMQYIVTTSCGTDTATHVMAIEAVLDIGGITGPDSVCAGYSVTLTHSYPGGTWLSSDSTIAKSMGGGAIRGIAPGSVTIMYIAVNS